MPLSPNDYLYLRSRRRTPLAETSNRPAWWDIPAKVRRSEEISDEEKARFRGHHNDAGDALRHSEWARRSSDEVGPAFTWVAGIAHEIDNLRKDHEPLSEAMMDLRNNAEGLAAARNRRPVDRSRLQVQPNRPLQAPGRGY